MSNEFWHWKQPGAHLRLQVTLSANDHPKGADLWRNVAVTREGPFVFDKISRSWALAGQCWDVLKQDPKLLVFPLLSSIALLILLGSFAVPVIAIYHSAAPSVADGTAHTSRLLFYITTYAFYVVTYTVMIFFNSALISVALKRLDGESASIGDGLRTALANLPAIVGYALIAATVGTLLRAIEER